MDSPLLEPTCPGLIAGADPHRLCFECLGPDHAVDGVKHSPSCNACRSLLRLRRQHRLEHFQAHYISPDEVQDQEELEVVEMEDQEVAGEVLFVFAILAGRAAPFVEEEEDEDFLVSGASGSGVHEGPPRRFPVGDGHGGGVCRTTAPLTTEAGEPPPSGVLRHGSAGAVGLRFAPVARYLTMCGGDVAAPTEDEGSSGWYGGNPQGAGPHGHSVSRRAPP